MIFSGHHRKIAVRADLFTKRNMQIGRSPVTGPIRQAGIVGRGGRLGGRLQSLTRSAATNASDGTSTDPTIFIRRFPSFWRAKSFFLRVTSPP